jgi:hypothetical protein
MRYAAMVLALLSASAFWSGNAGRCDDAAKSPFFDGKDLEGWEGLNQYWSVKDGAIVGSTFPKGLSFNTFLCSKKKYTDFELQFQVRLRGKDGNSGVQIRSKIRASPKDRENFAVEGPQCDMGQVYWGSLYGEHFGPGGGSMMKAAPKDVVARALKKDDFNDYYIKCVDRHVTVKLNGETTVDQNFPNLPDTGIIAWQIHAGPPMEVIFREIKFKDLSK